MSMESGCNNLRRRKETLPSEKLEQDEEEEKEEAGVDANEEKRRTLNETWYSRVAFLFAFLWICAVPGA